MGTAAVETVTGLFVGFMLAMAGVAISANALRMMGRATPPPAPFVIWPLIGSAAAKSLLSSVKFHYGRKIRSAALLADALNDSVDILSALAALVAVSLTLAAPHRFMLADHWGAFAVGLIVIFTGLRVTRDTTLQLMDTMPDRESMAHVRNAALTVPGVRGVEKCYARKTGLQYHVDSAPGSGSGDHRAAIPRDCHAGAHRDQGDAALGGRRAGARRARAMSRASESVSDVV
jgi:cation diffusion facilitator family transporter